MALKDEKKIFVLFRYNVESHSKAYAKAEHKRVFIKALSYKSDYFQS